MKKLNAFINSRFSRGLAALYAIGLFWMISCMAAEAYFGRDVQWPMLWGFLTGSTGCGLYDFLKPKLLK